MNSSELKSMAGDPEDDEDEEEEKKKSDEDEDEEDDDDEEEEETWRVSGELHYRAAPKDEGWTWKDDPRTRHGFGY
jgi:hypothetical protein